jgi:transposase
MARYKHIDTSPRLIAVDLERQLLPGTFEHALNYLVDHQFDLSRFDAPYKNDLTGASAYPPAMLLKVVLFAYSRRGIVSSRDIERACRDHVTFIALTGDNTPNFTTFAAFVSSLGAEIVPLFKDVLLICDRMGLIGREMFAIDGVKLPSNASKARSGTRADFQRQADKMEAAAQAMLARHRENDALPVEPDLAEKDARQRERLIREAAQLRQWLTAHPEDRKGARGKVIKSNRTDHQSAKMATSKGVIQGYTGVAAVDDRHQIIVAAQAHGTGSEQALLMPMLEAAAPLCTPDTLITADAGYHSDAKASYGDLMKRAIDSERGRALYGGRFATVEPVFANIRHNKGLDRFTLRGRTKVDTQWKLFCLVHNIEKLAHHGYGQ